MPITPPKSIAVSNNQALKNLDTNHDGTVDRADFPNLCDAQFEGAMMVASAMSNSVVTEPADGFKLAGKRIVFTGLDMKKSDAKKLGEKVGAEVKSSLSRKVDILVVGDRDKTTKDEQAIRMTASGIANIMLMSESAFKELASHDGADVVQVGNYAGPYETLEREYWDSATDEYITDYGQISAALLEDAMKAIIEEAQVYFENALDEPTPDNVAEYVDSVSIARYEIDREADKLVLVGLPSADWDCGFECNIKLSTGEIDYVESRD